MKDIERVISAFRKLPSVGPKQAERFALYVMNAKDEEIDGFIECVKNFKKNVKKCKRCFNYSTDELCDICKDSKRDHNIICVVENSFDLLAIEKTSSYNGLYYVLDYNIIPHSPSNEIFKRVDFLKKRVIEENIKEIIIALNTTTEGQTTGLYIKNAFKEISVKMSRIALGIPLGADIDYIDEFTLGYAIKGRITIDK